jgi:hypothetical protein
VQALTSLAEWQRDLECDFGALATERRLRLGGEREAPSTTFAGVAAEELALPAEYVACGRITVQRDRVTLVPLTNCDDELLVELVSDWDLTDGGLRLLKERLVGIRGLVPPQWMRLGGRAAVPFVDAIAANTAYVEWKISKEVQIRHVDDGRISFSKCGLYAPSTSLTTRFTSAEARLLLRALVSIEAWRLELRRCASMAIAARRMELAARIGHERPLHA